MFIGSMKLNVWKAFIGRYPWCLPGWGRGLKIKIINDLWTARSSAALICISAANKAFGVSDGEKVVRKPPGGSIFLASTGRCFTWAAQAGPASCEAEGLCGGDAFGAPERASWEPRDRRRGSLSSWRGVTASSFLCSIQKCFVYDWVHWPNKTSLKTGYKPLLYQKVSKQLANTDVQFNISCP